MPPTVAGGAAGTAAAAGEPVHTPIKNMEPSVGVWSNHCEAGNSVHLPAIVAGPVGIAVTAVVAVTTVSPPVAVVVTAVVGIYRGQRYVQTSTRFQFKGGEEKRRCGW